MEVVMATPALGPSLLTAPSGTCTCSWWLLKNLLSVWPSTPSTNCLAKVYAMVTLSFITEPS